MDENLFKSRMNLFRRIILPFSAIPIGCVIVSLFWPSLIRDGGLLEIASLCLSVPIGVIVLLAWVTPNDFDEAVRKSLIGEVNS